MHRSGFKASDQVFRFNAGLHILVLTNFGRKSPIDQYAAYIGNEVIGIFDADGQTHKAVAGNRFEALQQ
jgi:hypothetical protein